MVVCVIVTLAAFMFQLLSGLAPTIIGRFPFTPSSRWQGSLPPAGTAVQWWCPPPIRGSSWWRMPRVFRVSQISAILPSSMRYMERPV